MTLVLDAGPLYAFLDRRDAHHLTCRDLIRESREDLVIPAPVLVEVDYLLTSRGHYGAFVSLLEDIQAYRFYVTELNTSEYIRVTEVMQQYPQVGFVDAAVLAIVERLNEPKLATLDHRRFSVLRPRHVDALTLLP